MNPLLTTDSYKLGAHWKMLPPGTEYIHSYLEARTGGEHPYVVFFGLKNALADLAYRISPADVAEAKEISDHHLGPGAFNTEGWNYIVEKHRGWLPLEINAVPEGSKIPLGNVLMTVKNTDPLLPWLPGYFETFLLLSTWYPSTVATVSAVLKDDLRKWMEMSCDSLDGLDFKLHDFGGRSVTCTRQAEIGGGAHLLSFKGTDTVAALGHIHNSYYGDLNKIGFSVPATEHSVTCAWGENGESKFLDHLLNTFPEGILSVVGDTYDIYNFVDVIIPSFKDRILARNGKVVIRPDSNTLRHPNPADQVVYLLSSLVTNFGGTKNSKGYTVLNPKVGVLWGDGLSPKKINEICAAVVAAGFSIDPLVFGMGTGLLQDVNRDTDRFAFKASAVCINGSWKPIRKKPIDESKASKSGRLKLIKIDGEYQTISDTDHRFNDVDDEMRLTYKNGLIHTWPVFEGIKNVLIKS